MYGDESTIGNTVVMSINRGEHGWVTSSERGYLGKRTSLKRTPVGTAICLTGFIVFPGGTAPTLVQYFWAEGELTPISSRPLNLTTNSNLTIRDKVDNFLLKLQQAQSKYVYITLGDLL